MVKIHETKATVHQTYKSQSSFERDLSRRIPKSPKYSDGDDPTDVQEYYWKLREENPPERDLSRRIPKSPKYSDGDDPTDVQEYYWKLREENPPELPKLRTFCIS